MYIMYKCIYIYIYIYMCVFNNLKKITHNNGFKEDIYIYILYIIYIIYILYIIYYIYNMI